LNAPPRPEGGERIAARDGFPLAATRHGADAGERGLVLLVPATGVPRRFYDRLGAFLAGEGFEALAWDFRGTGESRPESLRGFRATMTDWATLDLGGVLDWAAAHRAGRPLLAVGHSFGGQAIGLAAALVPPPAGEGAPLGADPATGLDAVVTVGAQSGYWGHWPRPQRYLYAGFWYLGVPALTAALGYFPSRRLGLGENLPAGVARQWARWCRSPRYFGDWTGHGRFRAPILALSFADDAIAPAAAVEALHREYALAEVRRRHIAPREVGVARIGHFGFFKPGLPGLWRETSEWLAGASSSGR
jgi:predicted alpha/beta hydrolase